MKNKFQIITGEIKNGLTGQGEEIRRALLCIEGKRAIITIEEMKKTRSLNQNAFYWGVVLPYIVELFREHGDLITADEAHDFCRLNIGKLYKKGGKGVLLQSTTRLNTMDFEVYLENIRIWAAGFGVQIPLPNEQIEVQNATA